MLFSFQNNDPADGLGCIPAEIATNRGFGEDRAPHECLTGLRITPFLPESHIAEYRSEW
jgi:hypothetical protein